VTSERPDPRALDERWALVRAAAADLGFSAVGATRIEGLERDAVALRAWGAAGFSGDMAYMARPAALLAEPRRLAPAALSLVSLAVDYDARPLPFDDEGRFGRVARYAWGRDYHDVVRARAEALLARIAAIEGRPVRGRAFSDAVPLLERAAAARAGIGFVGKNTNLLRPAREGGSWFFLAEVLVDVELPETPPPGGPSCGTCRRCLDACPTGAFEGPYRLDARRCISYLTIECKGAIPEAIRPCLGAWVFGCDDCQDVCPFNRLPRGDAWPELRAEAGPGPRLDLVETLSIGDDVEFRARFSGTALLRPRRRGLLRNAAVAAANVGCEAAVPALSERVERDPEPLVRSHALWALARLDARAARRAAERARRDPDPDVAAAARAAAAGPR
jgi:epoxyqueuosine reductase